MQKQLILFALCLTAFIAALGTIRPQEEHQVLALAAVLDSPTCGAFVAANHTIIDPALRIALEQGACCSVNTAANHCGAQCKCSPAAVPLGAGGFAETHADGGGGFATKQTINSSWDRSRHLPTLASSSVKSGEVFVGKEA